MVTILFTNCAITVKSDINGWTYSSLINTLDKLIGLTDLTDPVVMVKCGNIKTLTRKLMEQGLIVNERPRKCIY